jgi:hypothetical protein
MVRSIGGRAIDLLDTDYSAMLPPPPVNPPIGLHHRIQLARDYYIRMDAVDYSVDPRVIGRFVDVAASPERGGGHLRGTGRRLLPTILGEHAVVTDPAHVQAAAQLRQQFTADQRRHHDADRHHLDGHRAALRALPDYDALFRVDFCIPTTKART